MKKIEHLRKEIDQIDDQILRFLKKRAAVAKKIGVVKDRSGDSIYSSSREQDILQRLFSQKRDPLSSEDLESIFQEIFNACRNIQRKLRIAFFGPEATFTHQSALKHFGKGAEMIPQKSITDVFVEVEKKRADYGVVPIENSTEGVVNHTLDMFVESNLVICAEREEEISHSLLSSTGELSKIHTVYSHPQALAQCRRWLEGHLPNADVHESASTADAACQASLDPTVAAIASPLSAKLYHLKVVAAKIEDYEDNFTRFLIVGRQSPSRTGKDKTSILFSIKDKVGALNEILEIFRSHQINLTKIESRPTKKKAWEYLFFVDFLGHQDEPQIQKALSQLKSSCLSIKIIGSYPRYED